MQSAYQWVSCIVTQCCEAVHEDKTRMLHQIIKVGVAATEKHATNNQASTEPSPPSLPSSEVLLRTPLQDKSNVSNIPKLKPEVVEVQADSEALVVAVVAVPADY